MLKSYDCSKKNLISLTMLNISNNTFKNFNCNNNELKSLDGSPKKVERLYDCSHNKLITLKGISEETNGDFICSNNKLTSLEYCPKIINGDLYCTSNKLKNIKDQIIKYQIKANVYWTDEGFFNFNDIKEEFLKYEKLLEKNKNKEIILFNKKSLNKTDDYGFRF